VFRLVFLIFLGLGLGLPSAFGMVEVEAGRAEVRRDGEGEVESRLTLLKALMLLSLLGQPNMGARYVRLKGGGGGRCAPLGCVEVTFSRSGGTAH
jgi:hypothetical protein